MPEYIPPRFRVINLNNGLRSEQERDLRRAIEAQNGFLDILIHPYYEDTIHGEDYPYPASPEYIRQRDEFIKSTITAQKPLVIFQDTQGELEAKTRDIQSGILYLVAGAYSNHLEFLASHLVGDILERVGVTHIAVGGRILMYADDSKSLLELAQLRKLGKSKLHAVEWLNRNRLPYGCPMWTATGFLKRGFDVSFSPLISPAVPNHD